MQFHIWNMQAQQVKMKLSYKKTQSMNIAITARHFTASNQLKTLIHEKIKKIYK